MSLRVAGFGRSVVIALAAFCGLMLAQAAAAAPSWPPTAPFDDAHRVHFQGLLPPIDNPAGAPNDVTGYLFLPSGKGPYPAVVLLPDCAGPQQYPGYRRWVDRLVNWGYATLTVDSLSARGEVYCFDHMKVDHATVVGDAYGALRYLATVPGVAANRTALVGFAFGANAALMAVDTGTQSGGTPRMALNTPALAQQQFHAVAAFYPTKPTPLSHYSVPVLILSGGQDPDWQTTGVLQQLAANALGAQQDVTVKIYPDATPGFDMETTTGSGGEVAMQPNPAATDDAAKQVEAFLAKHL